MFPLYLPLRGPGWYLLIYIRDIHTVFMFLISITFIGIQSLILGKTLSIS